MDCVFVSGQATAAAEVPRTAAAATGTPTRTRRAGSGVDEEDADLWRKNATANHQPGDRQGKPEQNVE